MSDGYRQILHVTIVNVGVGPRTTIRTCLSPSQPSDALDGHEIRLFMSIGFLAFTLRPPLPISSPGDHGSFVAFCSKLRRTPSSNLHKGTQTQ